MSRTYVDVIGEGDILQVEWRYQQILLSQVGMAVEWRLGTSHPDDDLGCTRPIPSRRTVLIESVYRMSTEDLSNFMSFPSSPLNLQKICACS